MGGLCSGAGMLTNAKQDDHFHVASIFIGSFPSCKSPYPFPISSECNPKNEI